MKVFEEYSNNNVWEYEYPIIQEYKPHLQNKNNSFLLDLCLKIRAYHFGILKKAKEDFIYKNLKAKSALIFVKHEKEIYGIKNIRRVENYVNSWYKASFEDKTSEEIKALMLNEELMRMKPKDNDAITLYQEFKNEWLLLYDDLRYKLAINLKRDYNLSATQVCNISKLLFKEVLFLANNGINQNYAPIVRYLEDSIEYYLPIFLYDLGLVKAKSNELPILRKSTTIKYNSACNRCSKRLYLRGKSHYCSQRVNRSCFNAKRKEDRSSGFPEAILRTKNSCENCGNYSSLNSTHKINHIQRQFCYKKCWESFRKRLYRHRVRHQSLAS